MKNDFEAYFAQTNGEPTKVQQATPSTNTGVQQFHTQQSSFAHSLVERTINTINQKSTELFEHFMNIVTWFDSKKKLEYQYKTTIEASTSHKAGWFFLLFVLFPLCGIFDYASISPFIGYMVSSSGGGLIGIVIGFVGWLFFVLLELATGWLIVYYAKDKPFVKFVAKILAVALIVTPSFLIYTTYSLTEPKSDALVFKTIALIIVSLILHIIFFLAIKEVWAGIFYIVYLIKKRSLKSKDPRPAMKSIVKVLQEQYALLLQHSSVVSPKELAEMLTNIAWYVRGKIVNSKNVYDLSDFNPDIDYRPKALQTPSKNS